MLVLFIYIGFLSFNMYCTPPLNALEVVCGTVRLLTADQRAILYTQPLQRGAPHPLKDCSLLGMGYWHGPLSDDAYDVSPGLVSRAAYLEAHG